MFLSARPRPSVPFSFRLILVLVCACTSERSSDQSDASMPIMSFTNFANERTALKPTPSATTSVMYERLPLKRSCNTCTSEVPAYDAIKVTSPYTEAKDMITRSVNKYCIVVDEEVNNTHVEEVATAMEGSMPINKKNGEKMSPPPTPTRPASKPVVKAITW
mmetsp:Transcript_7343/g.20890  ORF Transcript_7343/g.20890 Transcript_7343/m.20890 type:complete len:162 (+) Transcript_7343:112-597(+)